MLDSHQHLLLVRAEILGTTGRELTREPAGTPAPVRRRRLARARRFARALRARRVARTTMDPAGGLGLG